MTARVEIAPRMITWTRERAGLAVEDPLIFVNGADTTAAQIFTIAHEMGHILLGESGVSNPQPRSRGHIASERWCNAFAAEFLVPLAAIAEIQRTHDDLTSEINVLARRFKVSSLVALRRIHEAGWIDRDEFETAYEAELDRVLALEVRTSRGGDFYRTLAVRVGERFARAVVVDTLEGQTIYRDAVRMLGFAASRPLIASPSSSDWRSWPTSSRERLHRGRHRYYGFDLYFPPTILANCLLVSTSPVHFVDQSLSSQESPEVVDEEITTLVNHLCRQRRYMRC